MPLVSLTVTPSSVNTWVGQTVQFTATGTFTDGSNYYLRDLTNIVLWESDHASVAVSNSQGSQGLAAALSVGTAQVTASRGAVTSNEATVTVAASDTTKPTVISAQILSGNRVKVTFSEAMDFTTTTVADNYKITATTNVEGSCSSLRRLWLP